VGAFLLAVVGVTIMLGIRNGNRGVGKIMIDPGNVMPDATLLRLGDTGPAPVQLGALMAGQRVVIFGLPGAFTGTCTAAHVPSFIRTADAFREKGVSEIICVSVNDPWVMTAWGESTGGTAAGLLFLSDPASEFTEAIGMRFDAPAVGFIGRCTRFAALVNDGVVEHFHTEERRGICDQTAGETLLALV
jgi:peroxiredoxin